jgi:uncharacterized protein (DUF433 family)
MSILLKTHKMVLIMIDNKYISIDPNIAFGKSCIVGTCTSVKFILKLLYLGYSVDEILDEYP